MINSFKHVLLDLGGVVFNSTGESNDLINWDVVTQLNHVHGHQLNIGEDLFPQFMLDYNRLTDQSLDGLQFLEAIFDTLSFNQELVEMLGEHFEIYILSDNYRENIEYISRRYHFHNWAKKQFYSYELGLTKMDTALFEKVLTKLNLRPDEIFLVDDSPGKIETAASCGIAGILYQDNVQVKTELNV